MRGHQLCNMRVHSDCNACHTCRAWSAPCRARRRRPVATASQSNFFAEQGSVLIETSDSVLVPVTRHRPPACSLRTYMKLPVSQFVLIEVPLGGELKRVGVDIFDVVVAPLSFFDLWVQPHVRCRVRQLSAPECVDIQCIAFQLHSSQAVDRLQLNERVRFAVHTRFFCEGPPGEGMLTHAAESIRSTTHMRAEVAPPAPFSYLPAGVLTSVGEAALHAALANLQRTFVISLATDYDRWATDARYREARMRWAVQSDEAIMSGTGAPALSGMTL